MDAAPDDASLDVDELREKLIKIGAKVVRHSWQIVF
jgi:hypothetical protein